MKTKSGKNRVNSGVPAKRLNFIMGGITLVISVILLASTFLTSIGYKTLRETTEDYLIWQGNVNNMQFGSDYLTEQVRFFVEHGNRVYLDNYFKEADENKIRETSLEEMKKIFSGTTAYIELNGAMKESVMLMEREYYAMRLKIEAMGDDVSMYPEKIQNTMLTEHDAALSAEEKDDLAREMVFDEEYQESKSEILKHTKKALGSVLEVMESREERAAGDLNRNIIDEQILIIILIGMVIVIIILTTISIIRPLVKAVPHIKEEKPIPISGAYEFRFLAHTYNQIFEANNVRKRQLSYAASHDYLTGLFNRSGFDSEIKKVDLSTSALVIIDIDHFKMANDEFGHETGDAVLKKVAKALKENFRSYDIVSRFGGDEFAVLLLHVNESNKEGIIRKMREINDVLSHTADNSPPVSVSAGISFGEGKKPSELFKEADDSLYKSKNNGRHSVTFYGDDTISA